MTWLEPVAVDRFLGTHPRPSFTHCLWVTFELQQTRLSM